MKPGLDRVISQASSIPQRMSKLPCRHHSSEKLYMPQTPAGSPPSLSKLRRHGDPSSGEPLDIICRCLDASICERISTRFCECICTTSTLWQCLLCSFAGNQLYPSCLQGLRRLMKLAVQLLEPHEAVPYYQQRSGDSALWVGVFSSWTL